MFDLKFATENSKGFKTYAKCESLLIPCAVVGDQNIQYVHREWDLIVEKQRTMI